MIKFVIIIIIIIIIIITYYYWFIVSLSQPKMAELLSDKYNL